VSRHSALTRSALTRSALTRSIPAAALLLPLVGCVHAGAARRLEGHYDLGTPGDTWQRVKPGGADHAWYHQGLSASIYTDSNCASRFEDRPLDALLGSAVFGIAHGDPERIDALTVDGRDARVEVVDGTVDGVAVRIGAAVLKKDHCLYDLVYIAPPTTFDAGWPAFEQVLTGFHTQDK